MKTTTIYNLQARENDRLLARYDAETQKLMDAIIDEIIGEASAEEREASAREKLALEKAWQTKARLLQARGDIDTSSLTAIRTAVKTLRLRMDLALTLAYNLGQQSK
jgi:hypothetical protein